MVLVAVVGLAMFPGSASFNIFLATFAIAPFITSVSCLDLGILSSRVTLPGGGNNSGINDLALASTETRRINLS
jgi:hypothetical protein